MTESGSRCEAMPANCGMVDAGREIERHIFARHKEILVVDGECGLVAVVGGFLLSFSATTPHSKSMVSSNFFIVVSPLFSVGGKEGFPVLSEERGDRGNLQGVLSQEDRGDTKVTAE